MAIQKKDWKSVLVELENKLAEFFIKKLPAIPENIKEMIVKYGPYLALVGIIFSVPALLVLFGIGAVVAPWAIVGGSAYEIKSILAIIFGLVLIVLEIMALPGLFKRQMKAWKLLFYISLIQAVSNLIKFDLGGLIIGTGISWYVLFQIRSYYKN